MVKDFQGSRDQLSLSKFCPTNEIMYHMPLCRPQQLDSLVAGSILANSAQCLKQKGGRRKFPNSRCQALLSESQGHRGEQSVGFCRLSSTANVSGIASPLLPSSSREHSSAIKAVRHLSPSLRTSLQTVRFSKC